MKQTIKFGVALTILITCLGWAQTELTDGLVAYWPLDEIKETGITPDATPNTNDLFAVGPPSLVTGIRGKAVSLNGIDQYLYLQYVVDQGKGLPIYKARYFTISMWVKATGATQAAERTLFAETWSGGNNPLFRLSTDNVAAAAARTNVLSVRIRNNNNNTFIGNTAYAFADQGRSTLMPFDGNWHHVVWVAHDKTARLYVDGELDPREFKNIWLPEPGDVAVQNRGLTLDTLTLGATMQPAGTANYLNGIIDEVAIWERALTPEEIDRVRTNGIPTPISPQRPSFAVVYPPVGNTNLLVGEFFALQALAGGTHPRTYRWCKNGVPMDDLIETNEWGEITNAPIVGATSNILAFTNLQTSDSGAYSVIVSNDYGMITSSPVYLLVSVTSPQAPSLTNGQISYWPLDTIQGITTPDVVRGYDMLLYNMGETNLVPGKWGNAMKFYTNAIGMLTRTHAPGDALPINQYPEFTVSVWLKAPGVNNANGTVSGSGSGRRFFTECRNDATQPTFSLANGDNNSTPRGPVQKLRAFIRNDNNQNNADAGASGTDAYDDTWHHVVYRQRWVGGALPIVQANWFIDGVKDDPTVVTNNPISPRLPLSPQNTSIGGQYRAGSYGFQFIGLIDDVAVWNRALSEEEIMWLSTNAVPPAPPVLPPLAITSFKGDFARVVSGDNLRLSWVVSSSAAEIEIDQGIGSVFTRTTNGIGSIVVSNITSSKTFTLTIRRGAEVQTAQTSVSVVTGVTPGWSILDDFEAYSAGPLVNPYWTDARGGSSVEIVNGNRMLNVPADAGSEGQLAQLPLASYAIQQGQAFTIFARVYVADNPATESMGNVIGVTDKIMRTANDTTGDVGPAVRLNDDNNGDLAIGAIDGVGGTVTLIPRKLEQYQVYNIWIDITNGAYFYGETTTNAGDFFSVWIQRLGESSRTLVVSNYVTDRDLVPDFYGPTLPVLDKLFVANRVSSGTVYVDDIYISKSGYNSTVPVAWVGPAPPALSRPVLTVDTASVPGEMSFAWDAGALMWAPTIDGPWTVVPDSYGYTYTHTIDIGLPQLFFRVQR